MKSYVYVITHSDTSRHYVGKTNRPDYRWRMHQHTAKVGNKRRSHSYIHYAIAKYGADAFSFQVIEEFDTEHDAYESEAFWVEFLRSNVEGYGFNLESGGSGGKRLSESTRAKIGAASRGRKHTDEAKAKISKVHKGRKFSDEHRAKIGRAHAGKTISPEQIAAHSMALKGRKLSDSHKQKLSEARAGKKRGPMPVHQREAISKAKIGRKLGPFSEEHKRKISEAHKARMAAMTKSEMVNLPCFSKESIAKNSATKKAFYATEEGKAHLAEMSRRSREVGHSKEAIEKGAAARRGQKRTPEQRTRMSAARIEYLQRREAAKLAASSTNQP